MGLVASIPKPKSWNGISSSFHNSKNLDLGILLYKHLVTNHSRQFKISGYRRGSWVESVDLLAAGQSCYLIELRSLERIGDRS